MGAGEEKQRKKREEKAGVERAAASPGFNLLLQVMLHPHAQLVQLIPLLCQTHCAVLRVSGGGRTQTINEKKVNWLGEDTNHQ